MSLILPENLSRWQGEQPGDRPYMRRWMKRVWPPRGWWCCCGPSVCQNCANLQTLGTTSNNLCGGARNIDMASYTTPALSGLCMSICAQITGGTTGAIGVVIGGGPAFFARLSGLNDYGQQTKDLSTGCPDGTSTFTTFGSYAVNDTITLRVEDTSSGAGTYQVKCYINGTIASTTTGLAYTFTAGAAILIGKMKTGDGTCVIQSVATS